MRFQWETCSSQPSPEDLCRISRELPILCNESSHGFCPEMLEARAEGAGEVLERAELR